METNLALLWRHKSELNRRNIEDYWQKHDKNTSLHSVNLAERGWEAYFALFLGRSTDVTCVYDKKFDQTVFAIEPAHLARIVAKAQWLDNFFRNQTFFIAKSDWQIKLSTAVPTKMISALVQQSFIIIRSF